MGNDSSSSGNGSDSGRGYNSSGEATYNGRTFAEIGLDVESTGSTASAASSASVAPIQHGFIFCSAKPDCSVTGHLNKMAQSANEGTYAGGVAGAATGALMGSTQAGVGAIPGAALGAGTGAQDGAITGAVKGAFDHGSTCKKEIEQQHQESHSSASQPTESQPSGGIMNALENV